MSPGPWAVRSWPSPDEIKSRQRSTTEDTEVTENTVFNKLKRFYLVSVTSVVDPHHSMEGQVPRSEFAPPAPHFDRPGAPPGLSVVVPLLDEAAIVPVLVGRLSRVLAALGVEAEVVLVDDGSRDGTWANILRAHE